MKTKIKIILKHLVKEINGTAKQERKLLQESEIERLTIIAEREIENSEQYHIQMYKVHNAQADYMSKHGRYHPIGLYKKIESLREYMEMT